MADEYQDRWIRCDDNGITIRGYYFPWGTKHIAYASIRSWERVEMNVWRGRGRIWGTANPRYWASLDPSRPKKRAGFVLDLGHMVRPFVTPEDPDAFEAALTAHASNAVTSAGRSPVV